MTLKRYAIITKVEIYAGEEIIGTVKMSKGIGYKGRQNVKINTTN